MKRNLTAILAGIIAIAALVWAAVLQSELSELREDAPQPVAETAPSAPGATAATASNDDELAALRRRVGALERRAKRWFALTERLADRASPPGTRPDELAKDKVAALRADVDALLEGEGLDSAEAEAKMRELLEADRQARIERKKKLQAEAEREWLEDFAAEAKLSDEQLTKLNELARRRRDETYRIWAAVRSGEMGYREGKAAGVKLREELEAELNATLDADQLEAFWEAYGQERPGR